MAESVASAEVDEEITNIVPSSDRVVVDPDYIKSRSNRIIIPPGAVNRHQATTGVIIAIGDAVSESVFPFKVKDKVVFTRYAGAEIILTSPNGKERRFMVLNYSDILCSLEESPTKT